MDPKILLDEEGSISSFEISGTHPRSRSLDNEIKAAFRSGDVSESKSLHLMKVSQYSSNEYSYTRGTEMHKGKSDH